MKLLTSNKLIVSVVTVSSIVFAGVMKDYSARSSKVVYSNEKMEEEVVVERNVASAEGVAQLYLPLNAENIKKINAGWEITRIVGDDEKVAYDKNANQEDIKKSIKIKLELIGNGIVRIDGDNGQVYRVSMLSDFGTIAIYKRMGQGHEILEAKRLNVNKASNESLVVAEQTELVLERALNQSKSPKILTGGEISGSVVLTAKELSDLSVSLTNPNGESQSIEIAKADIMDGGAFKADVNGEEVSGVLFNNGKDGYRISFVTGPMAGAMLNFVTKDQMDKIQSAEEDTSYEQQVKQEEVAQAQTPVVEERKDMAQNNEAANVEVLTAEQVKETAQQNGFAF